MGALRRQRRPRDRHEDVRGLRAAQGAPAEVRLRARPRGRRRPRSCWASGERTRRPKARSSPLGATPVARRRRQLQPVLAHATGVELLLFDAATTTQAGARDSTRSRRPTAPITTGTRSCPGVEPGQLYGYRVDGPFDPSSGLRFDPAKVLLDPYGRGVVVPENYGRDAARRPGDNAATAMKSVVVDPCRLRLGRRRAPAAGRPRGRSSTRCTCAASPAIRAPASREKTRGTYAGLIEKIPYLQQLGITAVELLPVFQFDAQDCPPGTRQLLGLRAGLASSRRTRPTARVEIRSARSTSSATWSRRCTGPASRSFSTSCSTTPPKATTAGRRSASAASTTRPTTSSKRTARATPTTPAAATRSTPIIPSSAG